MSFQTCPLRLANQWPSACKASSARSMAKNLLPPTWKCSRCQEATTRTVQPRTVVHLPQLAKVTSASKSWTLMDQESRNMESILTNLLRRSRRYRLAAKSYLIISPLKPRLLLKIQSMRREVLRLFRQPQQLRSLEFVLMKFKRFSKTFMRRSKFCSKLALINSRSKSSI